MKFAVRHAFINVVRMPVRTALCFLIIFTVTAVSAVCIRLNKLTESARERFADEYPAVATVSVRVTTSPDGVRSYASKRLYLDDAAMLARSDTVRSYGISIFAGKLGEEEFMGRLPDSGIFTSNPPEVIHASGAPIVYAVTDLSLTEQFFSGDSEIISGRAFNKDELRGGRRAIVIPESVSAEYGISVGDGVTFNLKGTRSYALYRIVGIYRSQRGMTRSFIPFEDFSRECALFAAADLEEMTRRTDELFRIEFLLCNVASAEKFIRDAVQEGFDTQSFNIAVNDKPYKTVDAGLESICTVSRVILWSSVSVGTAILSLICIFYTLSRRRERDILRAMGAKKATIRAMFALEILIISVFAVSAGIGVGLGASGIITERVETGSLGHIKSEATESIVAEADDMFAARSLTLHAPLRVSLLPYEKNTIDNSTDGTEGLEILYLEDGTELSVRAVTQLDADGFSDTASYGLEICREGHRMAGYDFICYADAASGLSVGDTVLCYPQDITRSAVLYGGECTQGARCAVYLRVAGIYESNEFSGIVMPKAEAEIMFGYMGLSSNRYTKKIT